jgi:hypothetical protein
MSFFSNWKNRTLTIGAMAGIALGLLGAYLFIQNAEQNNGKPQLTAGDGVKVGVGVLAVLRQIADLAAR